MGPKNTTSKMPVRKNVLLYIAAALVILAVLFGAYYLAQQRLSVIHQHLLLQDQKISEQDKMITEQGKKVSEQGQKILEQNQTISEQGQKIAKQNRKLFEQERKLAELSNIAKMLTGLQDKMALNISHLELMIIQDQKISNLSISHYASEQLKLNSTMLEQERKIAELSNIAKMVTGMQDKMALNISHLELMMIQDQTIRNLSLSHYTSVLHSEQLKFNDTLLRNMHLISDNKHILEELKSNFSSIREQSKALGERINHPVNIFQQCHKRVVTCRAGSVGNDKYWKNCPTDSLPLSEDGYSTLSRWCDYKSDQREYAEILTQFVRGDRVQCDCDVIFPGASHAEHRPVGDVNGVCSLTIVRCPNEVQPFG